MLRFTFLFFLVCCSCAENYTNPNGKFADLNVLKRGFEAKLKSIEQNQSEQRMKVDSVLLKFDLVDVQSLDPSIQINLKYATTDNFTKKVLYHSIDRVYLQREAAERLVKCQAYLKAKYPNYSLLVFDALRPVSVQRKMWDSLDSIPPVLRDNFVSSPWRKSAHNYGAAVDLTIVDENGQELDMGAGYDDIRKIAYPSMESHYLKTGELTEKQVENRKLLREVMKSQRFYNIQTEWWHFNAYPKASLAGRFKILDEEPMF